MRVRPPPPWWLLALFGNPCECGCGRPRLGGCLPYLETPSWQSAASAASTSHERSAPLDSWGATRGVACPAAPRAQVRTCRSARCPCRSASVGRAPAIHGTAGRERARPASSVPPPSSASSQTSRRRATRRGCTDASAAQPLELRTPSPPTRAAERTPRVAARASRPPWSRAPVRAPAPRQAPPTATRAARSPPREYNASAHTDDVCGRSAAFSAAQRSNNARASVPPLSRRRAAHATTDANCPRHRTPRQKPPGPRTPSPPTRTATRPPTSEGPPSASYLCPSLQT